MRDATRIRRLLVETGRGDVQRRNLVAIQADRQSDEMDEAVWSGNLPVAVHGIEADWQRRRQVAAALDLISSGQYGLCDTCGHPIAAARLAALPSAIRCVACQAGHERVCGGIHVPDLPSMRDGFEQRYDDAA